MNVTQPNEVNPSLRSLRLAAASRASYGSLSDGVDVEETPVGRTHRAELYDRLHPATAGLFAGIAAGVGMLATADHLVQRRGGMDLVLALGQLVSRGALVGPQIYAAGFGAAAVAGAVVGALFATVTRHLRRFVPLLLWAVVFFPAVWTLFQAFALPRVSPWLASVLPFVPMVAAAATFGAIVSIQLPLRKGRAPAAF